MRSKLLAEWFWTDRWAGSSAFLLPLEARGLYREMLTAAWRRGGKLPGDHESIRRACGVTLDEWSRTWPLVALYWREMDGYLINDTQREVYERAEELSSINQRRARSAAEFRWRSSQNNARSNASSMRGAMLEQCPPSPSPSLDLDHLDHVDNSHDLDHQSRPEQKETERVSPALVRAFDGFWGVYPRKVGKAAAWKVWKRLHPNETLTTRIIEAVAQQKTWSQWTNENGRFIPHPATWLNQGRWDDETSLPGLSRVSDRTRANQLAGAA